MRHFWKQMLALMMVIIVIASTTGCGNSGISGKINLVSDGQSDYVIMIPAEATEAETYAAEELQMFFEKSTKVKLPIVKENEKDGKTSRIISVGHTTQFLESGIKLDEEKLYTDGFLLESKGNTIYITGAQDRGTLYGCYDFLERYLGIRFFAADETKIPKYKDLSVGDIHVEEIPDFWGRDSHFYSTIYNPTFAARMRQNGVRVNLDAKYGYGSMREWSTSWAHTFLDLVPPDEYYEEHPDWYTNPNVINGEASQICLTNPDVEKAVVEHLKKWIEEQPLAKYFSVSQMDIAGSCQCEHCQASDQKYLKSGTLIRFVNQVAKDIKEWADQKYPDREIYVVTFAYQHTTSAPVRTLTDGTLEPLDPSVVPADNVFVRVTSIWNCFEHDLMDTDCSYNLSFHDSLEGWASLTDNLVMWNYTCNFFNYLLPFNNYQTMARNYRSFKEYGITEILDNGAYDSPQTEMQDLRIYVQSKLMWDVDQDENQLIDEFVEGYYKEAAPYIKEYLEMQRTHFASLDADGDFHMRLYDETPNITDPQNYPKRYLEQQMALFDEALDELSKLPEGDKRAKLEKRVISASLAPRYMVLINYLTYYDESTLEEFAQKFFEDCDSVGLTRYREAMPVVSLQEQYLDE